MLSSLSIYKGVLTRSVPSAFHKLLLSVDEEPETFLNAYGDFYRLLCDRNASNSLSYTMTEAALFDENYFTRTATADKVSEMLEDEKKAVVRDIDAILLHHRLLLRMLLMTINIRRRLMILLIAFLSGFLVLHQKNLLT